jgi:hypothetical protein
MWRGVLWYLITNTVERTGGSSTEVRHIPENSSFQIQIRENLTGLHQI